MNPDFSAIVSSPNLQSAAVSDTAWRGELSLSDTIALLPTAQARSEAMTEDYATEGCNALQAQMLGLEQAYTKFMINAAEAKEPKIADRWLGLALRCQEQYRKSLRTIHEIRSPSRVQFIKSYVNQQLNQLQVEGQPQLEEFSREPMDTRAAAEAARVNHEYQTLAEINRTENGGG